MADRTGSWWSLTYGFGLQVHNGITSALKYIEDNKGILSPARVSDAEFSLDCPLILKEVSSPTPIAGHAQVYTKSDGKLYMMTGAGVEHELGIATKDAEMYLNGSAAEASIEAVDQWHGAGGQTAGDLNGWTFGAAAVADILSFADYSGTVAGTIKATTDGAHGFTSGDPVCLVGSNIAIGGANEYAGVYVVTVVDADEFYFTNANWNATTTAKAILPDRLIAGANAAGTYFVQGAGSATSAGIDKEYDFKAFVNATASDRIAVTIQAKQPTQYSTIAGHGTVSIVPGDMVWLGVMGTTDAANLTLKHANTFVRREHL